MCENTTKGTLQCKSKELKGMYEHNVLLQTPYAVLFTIIKKNVYKAPAPFPLAVYLYKSVTNIPLLINLQLHRKGRRKKKDTIKTTSFLWVFSVVLFQVERAVGARGVSGVPCRFVMSGARPAEAEQGCAVCHKHWLTSPGTPHMACRDEKHHHYQESAHTETSTCSGLSQPRTVMSSYKTPCLKNVRVLA